VANYAAPAASSEYNEPISFVFYRENQGGEIMGESKHMADEGLGVLVWDNVGGNFMGLHYESGGYYAKQPGYAIVGEGLALRAPALLAERDRLKEYVEEQRQTLIAVVGAKEQLHEENDRLKELVGEMVEELGHARNYVQEVSNASLHSEYDYADYDLLDQIETVIAKAKEAIS